MVEEDRFSDPGADRDRELFDSIALRYAAKDDHPACRRPQAVLFPVGSLAFRGGGFLVLHSLAGLPCLPVAPFLLKFRFYGRVVFPESGGEGPDDA